MDVAAYIITLEHTHSNRVSSLQTLDTVFPKDSFTDHLCS